jgi:hypothetical protein
MRTRALVSRVTPADRPMVSSSGNLPLPPTPTEPRKVQTRTIHLQDTTESVRRAGIRSWTGRNTSLGSVVIIEKQLPRPRSFPRSREPQRFACRAFEAKRHHPPSDLQPLVERCGGDQAAPLRRCGLPGATCELVFPRVHNSAPRRPAAFSPGSEGSAESPDHRLLRAVRQNQWSGEGRADEGGLLHSENLTHRFRVANLFTSQ